jgi:hypothetical protein
MLSKIILSIMKIFINILYQMFIQVQTKPDRALPVRAFSDRASADFLYREKIFLKNKKKEKKKEKEKEEEKIK